MLDEWADKIYSTRSEEVGETGQEKAQGAGLDCGLLLIPGGRQQE